MSIDVSSVSFHYPDGTPAVDELSFRARSGAVTAIVGPNGVGKTTLLELIAGDLEPAEGVISIDGQLAYMRQNPGFDGLERPTVSDALALGLPRELRDQYEVLRDLYARAASDVDAGMAIGDALDRWSGLGGYEVEAGFDQITRAVLRQGYDEARDRPLTQLSGGERKRVILSSFLVSPVPVLILDEPDNFLDLDGKAWLERELRATKKTVLMVSHDRTLLTAAVDRILVLEHNASWMHGGTYATLPTARRDRAEKLAKDLDRWHEEERRLFRYYKLMKQRASISPDMAKRADAAETRWERFRDAGPPTAPPPEREITTRFVGSRSGKVAMTVTDLEVPDLFLPFDLTVWNEERVLLLGENGVGKSTLLGMLRDVGGATGTELDDSPVRFGPTAGGLLLAGQPGDLRPGRRRRRSTARHRRRAVRQRARRPQGTRALRIGQPCATHPARALGRPESAGAAHLVGDRAAQRAPARRADRQPRPRVDPGHRSRPERARGHSGHHLPRP